MSSQALRRCWVLVALAGASASLAGAAGAEPPPASVQLALANPVQWVDADRSVTALRLSIINGENVDVTGFDLSGVVTVTTGTVRGLQIALVNQVIGECKGVQLGGFVNYVEGRLSGLQLSTAGAYAGDGSGAQITAFLAQAKSFRGFQMALFTWADEMQGLQIGFLNFNKNGFLPVFPIFNYGR